MNEPTLKPSPISVPKGEIIGQHKFPWKVSEYLGLAIVGGAGIGVMVISNFAAGALLFGGAFIAVVPYFIWLSNSRKKHSLIGIVEEGTIWRFTRRGIHDSASSNVQVDVSKISRIDMVDYTGMPNSLVLIERDEEAVRHQALAIPARLLKDQGLQARIATLAAQEGVIVTKRASEAISAAK